MEKDKKILLKAELDEALSKNEIIVAERFKLMLQIESILKENMKLDAEIDKELSKKQQAKYYPKLPLKLLQVPLTQDHHAPKRFWIGSLSRRQNTLELEKYFATFGIVIDVLLFPERRYGFVTIASLDNEESFLKKRHNIKGRRIKVERERGTYLPKSTTIRALGPEISELTDKSIKEFFEKLKYKVIEIKSRNNVRLIQFDSPVTVDLVLKKPTYLIGTIWIRVRK